MKPLTSKVCKTEYGWVGGGYVMCRQRWEIQPVDVGTTRPDFLGKAHTKHKFTIEDIGCEIEVLTNGQGYHSWYFIHHDGLKTQKP